MEENTEITEKIGEKTLYNDPKSGKFVKGNPGKPKGAKHKPKFLDELEEMLDEMAEGKDYTYRKALKKQILKRMIIDGDTSLLKEYWQQRDGKPLQRQETDITSGGDKINLKIMSYGDNDSLKLDAREASAPSDRPSGEIQSDSVAQESS